MPKIEEAVNVKIHSYSGGNSFLALPKELKTFLMKYLSFKDLRLLSETSKQMGHFNPVDYIKLLLKHMLQPHQITVKDLLVNDPMPKDLYLLYKNLDAAKNSGHQRQLLLNYASKNNKQNVKLIEKIYPSLRFIELLQEITCYTRIFFLDKEHQKLLDNLYSNIIKPKYNDNELSYNGCANHLIHTALLKQTSEILKLIKDKNYESSLDIFDPVYHIITPRMVIQVCCPDPPPLDSKKTYHNTVYRF